ncbi:MAG: hypothetical protein BM564_03055 [Bacteroidetes bacterium MedPE-SWsnd-G2]|nr:MAG: hypothetical protein BM564_03055 [Bacteroidetes bacterium MedPE-SWsnd-G2]
MALKITEKNGIFMVEGAINTATSKYFESHIWAIINKYNNVTINIDNVNYIDSNGLSILRNVYLSCLMKYNIAFYIVGNGCKEIYDDFRFNKVA